MRRYLFASAFRQVVECMQAERLFADVLCLSENLHSILQSYEKRAKCRQKRSPLKKKHCRLCFSRSETWCWASPPNLVTLKWHSFQTTGARDPVFLAMAAVEV